jgi:putative colanic acid biosynthesis glycosyltransferase
LLPEKKQMKVLQINSVGAAGSTGRIAEEIGKLLIAGDGESYIAFGRRERESKSKKIIIGSKKGFYVHVLLTRLTDRHGFGSRKATEKFLKEVAEINPDIIHLHNVHGYYINIQLLFSFLKEFNKPIVWTLHDCWAFTGHCAHFEDINCTKWKTHCNNCPKVKRYPASWGFDNSFNNFAEKKKLFSACDLHMVVPSKWLNDLVSESFLGSFSTSIIYNGIDINVFKPTPKTIIPGFHSLVQGKKIILGVANVWQQGKGLHDFFRLSKLITEEYKIVLVGLTSNQLKELPENIIGIRRTESPAQLAEWYSEAIAFVNPTWSDNFPTTNIEALACGTPVITYKTGGSAESINERTGFAVEKGKVDHIWWAIQQIEMRGKDFYQQNCRARAVEYFNKDDRYEEYLNLYQGLIKEFERG